MSTIRTRRDVEFTNCCGELRLECGVDMGDLCLPFSAKDSAGKTVELTSQEEARCDEWLQEQIESDAEDECYEDRQSDRHYAMEHGHEF